MEEASLDLDNAYSLAGGQGFSQPGTSKASQSNCLKRVYNGRISNKIHELHTFHGTTGPASMQIRVESRSLSDVVVIVPEIFQDERGFFTETFRADQFDALGLPTQFVQDNHSRSAKGVIRGLHFQWVPPMGKLMRVTVGSAFLVAVDIRKASPTLGKWVGVEASVENRRCVWAPAGFARGFCALSEGTEIQYKCTGLYNSQAESAIRWDDPAIGIKWPLTDTIVSEKDRKARTLAEWLASPESENFQYRTEPEFQVAIRS